MSVSHRFTFGYGFVECGENFGVRFDVGALEIVLPVGEISPNRLIQCLIGVAPVTSRPDYGVVRALTTPTNRKSTPRHDSTAFFVACEHALRPPLRNLNLFP